MGVGKADRSGLSASSPKKNRLKSFVVEAAISSSWRDVYKRQDYISRLRVYGKLVSNGGMQDVAVWSVATDNLPCFIIWIFADVVFTERSLLYAA